MLNILEGYDLKKMGPESADYWHLLLEAKKLAYADRARYYADPDLRQGADGGADREALRRRTAQADRHSTRR